MYFRPKSIPTPAARRSSTLANRPPATDLTVDHAIMLFLDSLLSRGMRESTLVSQGFQLRRFFGPVLGEPLNSLTPELVKKVVTALAENPSPRTGAPLAANTLNGYRENARRFTCWCTAQGRLSADPMAGEPTRVAWLHDEIDRLRKVVAETAQQRDDALAKLRTAGGAP